jgi:hypothetical protein
LLYYVVFDQVEADLHTELLQTETKAHLCNSET